MRRQSIVNFNYNLSSEMLNIISFATEKICEIQTKIKTCKLSELKNEAVTNYIYSSLSTEVENLQISHVREIVNNTTIIREEGRQSFCKDNINAPNLLLIDNLRRGLSMSEEIDVNSMDDIVKIHGILLLSMNSVYPEINSWPTETFYHKAKKIYFSVCPYVEERVLLQLLEWLKQDDTNLMIKAIIFRYKLEELNLFDPLNGVVSRYWFRLILGKWKEFFDYLQIEDIILEKKDEYNKIKSQDAEKGGIESYIIFMLKIINTSLIEFDKRLSEQSKYYSKQVEKLLNVIKFYPQTLTELMKKVGLKSRCSFLVHYIRPALELGCIRMTNPEKPRSRSQSYYKV